MKSVVYIVCDAWGPVRMTKREPTLARSEVAVKLTLTLTVPNSVFRADVIETAVEVPADKVVVPTVEVEA